MLFQTLLALPLACGGAEPAADVAATAAPAVVPVEPVLIETRDKVSLRADYYPPRKPEGRVPGVLLLHDADGTRAGLAPLAEQLQKQGLAVLTIDLRGHGESATPEVTWAGMEDDAREKLWAFASRDVEAAARWLRDNEAVHSTNLNLVSVGSSAGLAVHHAAENENVRSMLLLDPLAEQYGYDLKADLRYVAGLPTMIAVQGAKEAQAQALVAEVDGASFITLTAVARAEQPLEILEDRRANRSLSTWLEEQAVPRRGRGRTEASARGRED